MAPAVTPAVTPRPAPATAPTRPPPPSTHQFVAVVVLSLRTNLLRDWLDPAWAAADIGDDFLLGLPTPDQLL